MDPPVINLSDFGTRKEEITAQLMDAAKSLGFFYVTGHGISQDLIDAALSQAKSFFEKPNDWKDALPKVDWGRAKVLGYERNNLTDGTVHESFLHQYDCHAEMAQAWPTSEDLPSYRQVTLDFMNNCQELAARILACFASGLGMPEDFFEQMIKVDTSENHTFLQYHKYPSTENLKYKPGTLRYTAHTDESIMTLLFPSPGSVGLEVASGHLGKQSDKEGYYTVDEWMQFPERPGCITINIGDPLQMWSDGLLRSNFHRVRMPRDDEPKDARYSMGYFTWPTLSTRIEGPLGKYKAQTMQEFMEYKGKMYAASFSQDSHELESVQDLVFGNPAKDVEPANVEIQAQA